MTLPAALLALALAQDPVPAEPAAPPPAPAEAPAEPPAGASPGAPSSREPTAAGPARPKGADDATRLLKKWPELKPEERLAAIEQVRKQMGVGNPVLPPADFDFGGYAGLSPADQARVTARHFFIDLVGGETSGLVAHCGFPFFMEDRRFERPDELRSEWGKNLRTKRTDLLKLYDVEVLTPAEMEKKYGAPPRRLSAWGWRGQGTFLAVGNVSGHAVVIMLKQVGAAWQVVAYSD
jgi:hypothetical protein